MAKITPFEFSTATRIIFGAGTRSQIGTLAAELGNRALIAYSPSAAPTVEQFTELLNACDVAVTKYRVDGEPDAAAVEVGLEIAQDANCNIVIGIGGGSAVDAGKAIAALLTNGGGVLDYVEVVGQGQPIQKPSAPYIAVPTTAGTGAEVTRNAVIAVPDQQVKVSMRSPYMLPRIALVDPELTYTMPQDVTASTGLDAFTQLVEAYTCNRTNPLTDVIIINGLQKAVKALPIVYRDGNPQARDEMAYASLCSGLALANSGLGAVHGFAAVIGGRYPIPHGVCCAALLPYVVEANIKAVKERNPISLTNIRYSVIGNMLPEGKDMGQQVLEALPSMLQNMCAEMRIPSLSAYGVTPDDVPGIVEQAQKSSSMKANPVVLEPNELSNILLSAL